MSKDLFKALEDLGLLEYGSVIEGETVRKILGIEYPSIGTKADFDSVALQELGAIDYVRTMLLDRGKYISGHKDGYRILLPSENKKQVDAYMHQADKKLRRAMRLSKTMPVVSGERMDQTAARILLKQESIRHHRHHPVNT